MARWCNGAPSLLLHLHHKEVPAIEPGDARSRLGIGDMGAIHCGRARPTSWPDTVPPSEQRKGASEKWHISRKRLKIDKHGKESFYIPNATHLAKFLSEHALKKFLGAKSDAAVYLYVDHQISPTWNGNEDDGRWWWWWWWLWWWSWGRGLTVNPCDTCQSHRPLHLPRYGKTTSSPPSSSPSPPLSSLPYFFPQTKTANK